MTVEKTKTKIKAKTKKQKAKIKNQNNNTKIRKKQKTLLFGKFNDLNRLVAGEIHVDGKINEVDHLDFLFLSGAACGRNNHRLDGRRRKIYVKLNFLILPDHPIPATLQSMRGLGTFFSSLT